MIVCIDTRIGNLGSLLRAFNLLGVAPHIVTGPAEIESADAVILPGVGAFGDGMASLCGQGLVEPLRRAANKGTPVLGICLGMQLLFEASEEHGNQEGLGLIAGRVQRLDPRNDALYRVPNIGWCDVRPTRRSRLFPNPTQPSVCYFVHSYHAVPTHADVITATIDYAGQAIPVAVERGSLMGVQFHPEKSQDDGLGVLEAFLKSLQLAGRFAA